MSVKDIFEGIIPNTNVLEDSHANYPLSIRIVPNTMNLETGEVNSEDMKDINKFEGHVRVKLGGVCTDTQNGLFFKEAPDPKLVGAAVTAVLSELGWKKA